MGNTGEIGSGNKLLSRVIFVALGTVFGGVVGFIGFGAAAWLFYVCGVLSQMGSLFVVSTATVLFAVMGLGFAIRVIVRKGKNC